MVLNGQTKDNTNGSLYYYAHNLVYPHWAEEYQTVKVIGNHTFMKPMKKKKTYIHVNQHIKGAIKKMKETMLLRSSRVIRMFIAIAWLSMGHSGVWWYGKPIFCGPEW
jgi:uncharacterized membrane protein YfbV (UPF0208 family)